jgi:hypothetical protein
MAVIVKAYTERANRNKKIGSSGSIFLRNFTKHSLLVVFKSDLHRDGSRRPQRRHLPRILRRNTIVVIAISETSAITNDERPISVATTTLANSISSQAAHKIANDDATTCSGPLRANSKNLRQLICIVAPFFCSGSISTLLSCLEQRFGRSTTSTIYHQCLQKSSDVRK